MISQDSEFRLFDRGFKDTLLLIPGWATDYRIFEALDLDFNYLVPVKFSPLTFNSGLLSNLGKNRLDKISILGWSMGAFLASDFVSEYPEHINNPIFMVSVKIGYDRAAIEKIKKYLKKNRRAYLYKFYHECFSQNEKEVLSWFKTNLLKSYLDGMDTRSLFDGLEYLLDARLEVRGLENLMVKFIHGENDRIAPIEGASEIERGLPRSEFIPMKGAGHIPFLNPSFSNLVRSGRLEDVRA